MRNRALEWQDQVRLQAALLVVITAPLLALTSPDCALVAHTHIAKSVAVTVVTLTVTGSWERELAGFLSFPSVIPGEVNPLMR
jgi:hypothetical protein